MIIDTHCHVDLYDAPHDVVRDAEAKSIATISVTYLPSHFRLAQKHLHLHRCVRPALGLHPLSSAEHARELLLFTELCPSVDYIGEIGLDFSAAGKQSRSTQEASFETVLNCLRDRPRFISLHSRGAEDVVLADLKGAGLANVVFHWFSGSREQLIRILDAGHLLSVNPAMIRAAKWKEFIRFVPRDAILTESDGPFVKQDGRPALPADMRRVIDWLATSWGQSREEAEHQVSRNCDRVPVLGDLLTTAARMNSGGGKC